MNLSTDPLHMEIIHKYFSDLTTRQLDQLTALEGLYKEWNEKINIISRKDIDGLYEKHVLHSLSIAAVFKFPPDFQLLDLGTGGGFPGVPLAIFFPEVKFHLVDSIAKKLKVVDAIANRIGLTNVSTQHSRAEDLKNTKFNFVVTRAVAPLKDLWKWSKPLLSRKAGVQGSESKTFPNPDSRLLTSHPGLICLKGGDLAEEIQLSGLRPHMTDIHDIFPEAYFREKFILYVPL